MKVRRFNIEQNGAVMTKDGEFLHINDVMLFHVHQLQHLMHHCGIEKEIITKETNP